MRLIDADAFAAEMKKRQDGCQWRLDNPVGNTFYTDREHWMGVFAAFVEAKITLNTMPTVDMRGWISVKERMPEPNVSVLLAVYDRDHGFTYRTVAWLNTSGDWDSNDDGFNQGDEDVLYWCVLPEPPEEVSVNATD